MLIRAEEEADGPAVHAVNASAFETPAEANLVDSTMLSSATYNRSPDRGRQPMELTGDRITLREHIHEDWVPLAAYQADARYLQFNPAEGSVPEQARRLAELFVTWAGQQPRENYQLAVVHRATGHLIGSAGLRMAGMAPGCAEFGLELSPDWWGRGLAAESSRLLLGFGFDTLALEQIRGMSVTENAQVARLVQRFGFVEGATHAGNENAWMRARAWSFTEWVLTKDAWTGGAG